MIILDERDKIGGLEEGDFVNYFGSDRLALNTESTRALCQGRKKVLIFDFHNHLPLPASKTVCSWARPGGSTTTSGA